MNEQNSQLTEFADDWLQREPNLAICYRFAAKPTRWLASVLLIEELLQMMFSLSNQELAQAKMAWWADEGDLAVSGAPRHPLTQALVTAKSAEKSDLAALPALVRAAQAWITCATATDTDAQRTQFSEFAAAASTLVNEGDCSIIWIELALKRQLQSHAKPDRYGPSVLSRAALAEFQLKASQIGDVALVAAALSAKLIVIRQSLRDALPTQAQGAQSATRAYGLLHAREAGRWAKSALAAQPGGFLSSAPSLLGLVQAWWVARS